MEAESGERTDMAAAAAPAPAESNVEFIRARSDKREYRRVVLPNALECLLISDSETDKVSPSPIALACRMLVGSSAILA